MAVAMSSLVAHTLPQVLAEVNVESAGRQLLTAEYFVTSPQLAVVSGAVNWAVPNGLCRMMASILVQKFRLPVVPVLNGEALAV